MAIVGIDLGTTNSVVATMEDGRVEVINNYECKPTTPSVVFFNSLDLDGAIVGEAAVSSYRSAPDRGVRFIKRMMGQDFTAKILGQEFTPEQISSVILKKLLRDAKEFFNGEEVTDAVITVPAWFEMREREATERAAEMAGLKVRALCPEPIAAAIDFSQSLGEELAGKTILVYDLGGGTFDVTLMKVEKEAGEGPKTPLSFRILDKDGSIKLGGVDWDTALANHVCEEFASANPGQNPRDDTICYERLLYECQEAKQALSHKKLEETVDIPCTHAGITYAVTVSRAKFEELTSTLLSETFDKAGEMVHRALGSENPWQKVDIVLLAGGSTKMPAVLETLEKVAGKPPRKNKGVDLNVGRGAAYLAFSPDAWTDKTGLDDKPPVIDDPAGNGTAQPRKTLRDLTAQGPKYRVTKIADTATLSVGINVVEAGTNRDINYLLIRKGSQVGEEIEEVFGIHKDGQTGIDIIINGGDSSDLTAVEKLGHVVVSGLPATTRAGEDVRVKLRLDGNGLIVGECVHGPTGIRAPIMVHLDKKKADKID